MSLVFITGVGLVSSLGVGREAHLPLRPRVLDESSFAPWPVHPLPALGMETAIPRKEFRQMEDLQRLGTYTAGLALSDAGAAGLGAGMDLVVASGGGERDAALDEAILSELSAIAPEAREAHIHRRLSQGLRPTLFLAQLPNLLAGSISIVHKIGGSSRTLMGEEAAGAEAVRIAAARIAAGTASVVLVGGASQPARWENLLIYAPFLHQGGWCPTAARPGMVMGAQAAFLVLESAEHAAARGARVLARLSGVSAAPGLGMVPARPGLNVSAHAGGPAAVGDEWLADWLGAGLEAAFPVGIALAALRVAAGDAAVAVHGAGHADGTFSAVVEPAR